MKNYKQYVFTLLLTLFTGVFFGQQSPNILIIHVDDFGYHDLSFNGSILYDTPNMDALARESVSFTNAYSNYPRCVPSRYALMTGTYPVRENKGSLANIPKTKNFIKQFNEAGYNSYYVGKWHLGENENGPLGFGFTSSYAAGAAGGAGSRFYPFNTEKFRDFSEKTKDPILDVEKDGKMGDYLSDLLTDKAIEYISQNPKEKPFVAVMAYYAVHTPIEAKPKDEARNKKQLEGIDFGNTPEYIQEGAGRRKMRQDDPAYAAMVENVDENVGRLLKTIHNLGLDKNTIILLTSDHGGLSNDGDKYTRHLATTNNPLRAGKGWLYEGGIRVPLYIKWPGKLIARQDTTSIIMGMDIYPTLLDLAISKEISEIDGKSFENVLRNQETWKDRTVYWKSDKARPYSTGDPKTAAVRSGDFKLLQFPESNRIELYNVKEDVEEANDLSTKMPTKKQELLNKLMAWKSANGI